MNVFAQAQVANAIYYQVSAQVAAATFASHKLERSTVLKETFKLSESRGSRLYLKQYGAFLLVFCCTVNYFKPSLQSPCLSLVVECRSMRVVQNRKVFSVITKALSSHPLSLRRRLGPYSLRCPFAVDHERLRLLSTPRLFSTSSRRRHETQPSPTTSQKLTQPYIERSIESVESPKRFEIWTNYRYLPASCPGCGALTQSSESRDPGYYSQTRRVVRRYIKQQKALSLTERAEPLDETDTRAQSEGGSEPDANVAIDSRQTQPELREKVPYCNRCHDLIYNSQGQPIAHPSIENLADSIAESPFRRNHVYHILDAADFPMSLIPDLFSKISLAKLRSQNRRSQHDFSTKPTMSFIITRSDLLGPTKETVDRMMAYFRAVLRAALGRFGNDLRLGNLHLVSAKRGWWTKELKEEIWKRGGGTWMFGKVNVGKSNLFEVLFPKGSGDRAPRYSELRERQESDRLKEAPEDQLINENSLLPPAQQEVPFPVLPVVSSLPGTTASPIRLPFGGNKGELIDLPGLERGSLEEYVKQEHKLDLIMTHRPNVEQHIIKPGQSLVLGGGLVRITPNLDPNDPSTTMLAYPFVPLKPHVTSTEKAIVYQSQQSQSSIDSIVDDGAGTFIASAGLYRLATDVTSIRAGPVLRSGVSLSQLPYRVYATDILLEGIGWVELVCQTRRVSDPLKTLALLAPMSETSPTDLQDAEVSSTSDPQFAPFSKITTPERIVTKDFRTDYPTVEVFTPKGKHVSSRVSLSAWPSWTGLRRKDRANAALKMPKRSLKKQ